MDQETRPGKGTAMHSWSGRTVRVTATVAFLLGAVTAREIAAQTGGAAPDDRDTPGWVGQFTVLSANAVLSGVTAGIGQKLRGGSFADGFTRGFLGGTVIYAGKRVAVERFAGAGLVGRNVASIGASMVRNAGDDRGALDYVLLSFGPLRFHLDRAATVDLRVKLDLSTALVTALALSEDDLDLDLGSSVSAGAPVFKAREMLIGDAADTARASGAMVGNVILLSELPWRSADFEREVFAHERVHVLQRDQVFLTIADPFGKRIIEATPGLRRLSRYVDIHFTDILFEALTIPFQDYYDRPWEMEAFHLMER